MACNNNSINQPMDIPDTGAVFTWGRSKFSDNQPSHFFIRNDPIVDISCGDEHTVLVCQKGRVFVFGNNGSGQLGLGHTRAISKPTCVKALKPWAIALSACGRAHSLFSTNHSPSLIFSCGANSDGQLGLGDQLDRQSPTQINFEFPAGTQAIALAAGSMHSALLTNLGEVWTWGNNTDGQCGVNLTDAVILIPTKVPLDVNINSLACGYYHTLFASRDTVWAAGEGDSGKLGLDNKHENQMVPKKVAGLEESEFIAVAAGGSHSLVLTANGEAYGFGNNFSVQLGVESSAMVGSVATQIQMEKRVTSIACGESHSAFLSETGQLWTCGDTRYGKLGHDGQNLQIVVLSLPVDYRVTLVKCGGCHTVALASPSPPTGVVFEAAVAVQQPLPPIKLKRHSITISSPSSTPRNDDEEIKLIEPEKKDTGDDDDDDDDDVEQEDTHSLTESAHCDSQKEVRKTENDAIAAESIESPVTEPQPSIRPLSLHSKLLGRFRAGRRKSLPSNNDNLSSKACSIL